MRKEMSGVLLLLCIVASVLGHGRGVDFTLVPGTAGSDIVRAVNSKIDALGMFPTDNRLLRRIAFVESKDGSSNDTYRENYHGGIWQVNEDLFNETQDTSMHPELVLLYDEIDLFFAIDWRLATWEDLRKPFYSGLAARLFLSTIGEDIPTSSDYLGQGNYWMQHYNPSGIPLVFVNDVIELALQEHEECTVNTDLIFVLDSSGSITADGYENVRQYVRTFSEALEIGPEANQVGVIIFGDLPETVFNLSTHSNKTNLLNGIDNIPYLDEYTNTGDALRLMIDEGFTPDAGARLDDESIFRLAIVLTDGKSNRGEDVVTAAAAVHAFKPPILVYVIGVTNNVNQEQLESIATSPSFIDNLENFDPSLLLAVQLERSYEICFTTSLPQDLGDPVVGTLDQGQQVRYQFPVPEEGLTVRLCVRNGFIVLYASTTIPNPNQAYYDWKLECIDCDDCEMFVDPGDFEVIPGDVEVPQRRRRQAMANTTEDVVYTNFTVYISVEGMEDRNTFELNTEAGDTTEPDKDSDNIIGIIIGSTIAGVLLLVVAVVIVISIVVCVMKRRQTYVV